MPTEVGRLPDPPGRLHRELGRDRSAEQRAALVPFAVRAHQQYWFGDSGELRQGGDDGLTVAVADCLEIERS